MYFLPQEHLSPYQLAWCTFLRVCIGTLYSREVLCSVRCIRQASPAQRTQSDDRSSAAEAEQRRLATSERRRLRPVDAVSTSSTATPSSTSSPAERRRVPAAAATTPAARRLHGAAQADRPAHCRHPARAEAAAALRRPRESRDVIDDVVFARVRRVR